MILIFILSFFYHTQYNLAINQAQLSFMTFTADTSQPNRELDSLYISVKDGKWIKEGPVTKVSNKYGGTPPFIPEVTKCYPCPTDTTKVKD